MILSLLCLPLLQEPIPTIPDFSTYGFYGSVVGLLVFALWLLWRRLGERDKELRELSNDHSNKLMTVIEKNNAALDGVGKVVGELSTEIRVLNELHRKQLLTL